MEKPPQELSNLYKRFQKRRNVHLVIWGGCALAVAIVCTILYKSKPWLALLVIPGGVLAVILASMREAEMVRDFSKQLPEDWCLVEMRGGKSKSYNLVSKVDLEEFFRKKEAMFPKWFSPYSFTVHTSETGRNGLN